MRCPGRWNLAASFEQWDIGEFWYEQLGIVVKVGHGRNYPSSTHLSVGDVKVLLHNAAMVERLFSMFGNRPNLKINNTDFKELLFYGVCAAA